MVFQINYSYSVISVYKVTYNFCSVQQICWVFTLRPTLRFLWETMRKKRQSFALRNTQSVVFRGVNDFFGFFFTKMYVSRVTGKILQQTSSDHEISSGPEISSGLWFPLLAWNFLYLLYFPDFCLSTSYISFPHFLIKV